MVRSIFRSRNRSEASQNMEQQPSPFFQKSFAQNGQQRPQVPFFQAKLTVNQPNDKYEQEADAVAAAVVSHNAGTKPAVQQKKISSIQRLATPLEDEKLGTNDARMLHDKEIQEKPEVQRMCPECEKEKKKAVQKKSEVSSAASPQLSSRIEGAQGRGRSLPEKTRVEMGHAFGVDFGGVNIHTDAEAVQMNKQLSAQAFTHGSDIYFNTGKYNPESSSGKQLLAHELTHVVQQQGAYTTENNDPSIQRLSPAIIAGGVLAAAILCTLPFYNYALDHYAEKGDKWMHCWVSCKITTYCGGPVFSTLVGAGKEAVDAAMDAMGYEFHAEFADFVADMVGTYSCLLSSCYSCCDENYS